ncbi:restriction endonuclease subunit S [Ochrobactrum teleogrylli]|uniref:Restriction endonuclease subunit S n=1 Tax=Ochrobactrum teleogrylli TaxID=2479765 RepID=A0ABY2XZ55_9HYPH|nr:restriction endonuclease subunit S [[Ochrobactrum] teleogrylli]TNV10461.1 restriction endonuclease subunit S [[Ochrobactrum] teleogrylli]
MTANTKRKLGGREATSARIDGDFALAVGKPDRSPPSRWEWRLLTDLARLESGHTPSRKKPEYWGGDIPWIGIRDATGNHGRTIYETKEYTNEHGIANSAARVLPPNTVCLSRTASVGYVVVMGRPMATSQDFVNWSCSKDLEATFLKYALIAEGDALLRFASGSVHQTIYFPEVKSFYIATPPLREQRAIAEVLGSLDDKIELNRRMNETLEAMAQAIFRDWFVDFGPTRRKLEGATDPLTIMGGLVQDTERAQALAHLFPDKIGDDGLPAGWEERQVGDVTLLLRRGLAPSYSDEGILVINQKCIRNKAVNLALARRHDAAKRPANDRLLEEYDVVVNSTGVGTLGRVATVRGLKQAATADSHVTICRADTSKVSKLVLSLFMEGQEALIETLGHGSTGQTELSPASLSAMVFPVAPEPVQLAFESLVMPLRDLVTSNSEQSLTLAETRDLLLPKLMSGEICLSEAEVLAEPAH